MSGQLVLLTSFINLEFMPDLGDLSFVHYFRRIFHEMYLEFYSYFITANLSPHSEQVAVPSA